MSVLNGILYEEYDRINRVIFKIEQELSDLPRGYISEKKINGKVYYYLQYRENGKLKSVYLKGEEVVSYRSLIDHRNELQSKLKELQADRKKIEKVLD